MGQDYPQRGPRRDFNGNRGQGNFRRSPADYGAPRERVPDEIIADRVVETDRKVIRITHRRNAGGEFLRLDETRRGQERSACVIIPADAIEPLLDVLDELFPAPPGA